MPPTPQKSDWVSLAILGVVWGSAFMFISLSLDGYGPLTVATIRTSLGAIALLIAMAATGRGMPNNAPGLWRSIFLIGILSTSAPFFLLSWGIQRVPSAFAGLAMTTVPLIILPLAHFFSDERMTLRGTLGVVLGFVGAIVLIAPSLFEAGLSAAPLAQLACVGAAACYAVSSVLTRRCPPIDPLVLSALMLTVGAITLVPVMLLLEGLPDWGGFKPSAAIVFLGLLPTAGMTLLRIRVIQRAGSVFLTLVNYQVPLWAVAFGAFLLSETLPKQFFVALVIILVGLTIGQWTAVKSILFGSKPTGHGPAEN